MYFKSSFSLRERCIAGDFNAIKKKREKKYSSKYSNLGEMHDFNEFIEIFEVVDVPIAGSKFTLFRLDCNE